MPMKCLCMWNLRLRINHLVPSVCRRLTRRWDAQQSYVAQTRDFLRVLRARFTSKVTPPLPAHAPKNKPLYFQKVSFRSELEPIINLGSAITVAGNTNMRRNAAYGHF